MSLYEDLLTFCKDDSQHFFTSPKLYVTIFKTKVSDQTIALLKTSHPIQNQLLLQPWYDTTFDTLGFYRNGEVYLSPKASLPLHCMGENENDFKPYPLDEMMSHLNKSLTDTLRSLVGEQPPLYSDKRLTNMAKEKYMKEPTFTAKIDIHDVFSSQYFSQVTPPEKTITSDNDIEAYLDDGDKWINDRVNLWLSDKDTKAAFVRYIKDMLTIEAIIQEVKGIPDHSWNRKLRFLQAIKDKQRVVLDVKYRDSILTFHYDTNQLHNVDGSFYTWWIPASERVSVEKWISQFAFDDILDVMYRGKIIYQKTKNETDNMLPAKFLPKVQAVKQHFKDLTAKLSQSGRSFEENVAWLQNATNDDGQSLYENVSGYDDNDSGQKRITLDYHDVTSEIVYNHKTGQYSLSDICTVFVSPGSEKFVDNFHW